jgi:EmrB/QacA subfamily drug resistance transporter
VRADIRRWLGLVTVALGVALIVVDTTIVNVIIPSIVRDLSINSTQTQWVQESYAIMFAALLLLVGRVADIVGARRVFLAGAVVFGAASVLAGLAGTGDMLIAARFTQGIGGALILPTSLALLNTMFSGPARAKAFAVWGSTIGAGSALGPLLGGWLAVHFSWRWAFGVNLPLVLVIIVGALMFIDRSERRPGRIDIPGALLSILGLGLLAFGLIGGRTYGWLLANRPVRLLGLVWASGPSLAFVALLWAVVALTAFGLRQAALSGSARSDIALMDLRLFGIASFRGANIATMIIGIGEFGIIAVLPLWLQFTLGYTPVAAGLALVPIAVGSFVASGVSFGVSLSALTFVRVGLVLEAVGLSAVGAVATAHTPWWHLTIALFVYGIGVGFATAQVTNVALNDVPEMVSGQASGIQSAFRQLGSALGIAVLTTSFFTIFGSTLRHSLTAAGTPAGQADTLSHAVTDSAGAAIAGLAARPETARIAAVANDALTQGLSLASYLAAGFVILGVVATALIPTPAGDATAEASLEANPGHPVGRQL